MLLLELSNDVFADLGNLMLHDTVVSDIHHDRLAIRMIEDTDLIAYVLAKGRKKSEIDKALMVDALKLINQDEITELMNVPEVIIVTPGVVQKYLKAPLKHDDEAISQLSRFVNHQLVVILRAAGLKAKAVGTDTITRDHIFECCHLLPYPFNVWLC